METVNAVGRRKAAVARVILKEGNGAIVINKRPLEVYFPSSILQYIVKQPLNTLGVADKYDIHVNLGRRRLQKVRQRHSVSVSLAHLSRSTPKTRQFSRKEGFMTRDPRACKNRKKPGQPKSTQALPVLQTLIVCLPAS